MNKEVKSDPYRFSYVKIKVNRCIDEQHKIAFLTFKQKLTCEIPGYLSGAAEFSSLLKCYALSTGK
jgi:hypothetical protein